MGRTMEVLGGAGGTLSPGHVAMFQLPVQGRSTVPQVMF